MSPIPGNQSGELTEEERVTRLEYAIWGLTGDNGLKSEVRHLRHELRNWREDEARKRERLAETKRRDDAAARVEKRRNRLTAIGIGIAGLAALTTAILQIAGAG